MPMLAVAVALSLALPAAAGARVPGLALRFGESLARVDSTHAWIAEAAGGSGVAVRNGRAAYFGVPCDVKLRFEAERLTRVQARTDSAAPHELDYVRDELRRLGLRRECETDTPARSLCTWSGRTVVTLDTQPGRLTATMVPAAEPPPARVAATAPAPPEPQGPPPDFVLGDSAAAAPFPLPVVTHRQEPVYPSIARRAGVMGRVRVRARVDTTGAVVGTEIVGSVPMLDPAAESCVMRWRFEPYLLAGRAWPIRVVIPVVFTLR